MAVVAGSTPKMGQMAHDFSKNPMLVYWEMTQACGLACKHCRAEAMPTAHPLELNGDESRRFLRQLVDFGDPLPHLILTGGDPFVLSPRRLKDIVQRLAAIEPVTIIRVHTRVPVVEPERITPALVRALKVRGKATYVVLHANHARELTPKARASCARLIDAGIPMLAQSVLLRGVNDDPAVLESLLRGLVAMRVKPYYLHQLDPAPGTTRFHVPIEEGRRLLAALRGRMSGLAWPTYVLDIPGGYGKVPIGPDYLEANGEVRDPSGRTHAIAPPGARIGCSGGFDGRHPQCGPDIGEQAQFHPATSC